MLPLRPLTVLLLVASTSAQTTHLVGPGGFVHIQGAINAATNGDVIVVQTGTYAPFTLTKNLTITAAPGATVDVSALSVVSASVTVVQPPQRAIITGLRFLAPAYFLFVPSQVQVLGGTTHFADCVFESTRGTSSPQPPAAALRVQDADVALQRCFVFGGGVIGTLLPGAGAGCDGLSAQNANVAAVDTVFLGGNLHWDFSGHGGHGIVLDNASLHLANCIAIGGTNDPVNPGYPSGDGVRIATASPVWLADSRLQGGRNFGTQGGAALRNLGPIAARHARSTFVAGLGVPTGPAVVGPLGPAPLLGFAGVTPPIVLGTPWAITHVTTPLTPVLALWSGELSVSSLPLVAEIAWLPTSSFAIAAIGVTDAAGLLTFAFPVPANPALLHAPFFVQGVSGLTLPLEAAPPVGGVLR